LQHVAALVAAEDQGEVLEVKMDAIETILRAATREFIECPAWQPTLLRAWKQLERENGWPTGWGGWESNRILVEERERRNGAEINLMAMRP
jgi:hypothetical protein